MLFLNLLLAVNVFAQQLTYDDIEKSLTSAEGLVAEVHGADQNSGLYVLAVRNPENFFDFINLPIVADYGSQNYVDVKEKMGTLDRHDFVRVRGKIHQGMDTPQKHALINSLEVVRKFDGGFAGYPDYEHEVKLPGDLLTKNTAIVKVHAVAHGGKMLVVEYKDTNVPVMVANVELTKNLYRNDKIEIQYDISPMPRKPTHLILRSEPTAVRVLDSLVVQHGQPIEHCGDLVMFPKSPMVVFNVFAIMKDIGDGLFRSYTLINFEDRDLFSALREKAQKFWDEHPAGILRGRNYYVNPGIRACAKGTINVVDPSQANPQIIINDSDNLSFEAL